MARPKNKDEYRAEMADAFAHVLEERGLEWRKEWTGSGGGAPHNGITKACYRGTNAFWLSLVSMLKGYSDPRWVTMVQIMDNGGKYHPKQEWHLKAGSKATYVEYWYPYDTKNKKALTWEQYKDELASGRKDTEFTLSTRYTAVFNASEVEGMPEIQIPETPDAKVSNGTEDKVATAQEEAFTYVDNAGKNLQNMERKVEMKKLEAPVKQGDEAGIARYFLEDQEIGTVKILTTESVEKMSYPAALGEAARELLL